MRNWVMDVPSILFGNIKTSLNKKFKGKNGFDDLYITTSSRTPTNPKFPTVYVKVLPPTEQGETFDVGVNAMLLTLQIEVTTVESENQAKQIMAEVINIMTSMYFKGIALPYSEETQDTYRMVARFRRMIGSGDVIPNIK